MANTKSAKKQARQNKVNRARNLSRRTALKTAIKKVMAALETTKDAEQAKELLKVAEAKIARAKNKNVLHKNTASRKISRLAKRVATAQKAEATK
ncbi:30S ribosomal protein S20 [Candidatus Dependentiae bacterium Noda2021]|nr:30S ribosomal protein S20 [Candidatus Dependentiae bacterium Noda2021]